jgi:arylsulfatase A-like enzyme
MLTSCKSSPEKNESKKEELPNIILLMGDDHGWDETGYNGHPFVHTPVLDEMAAKGVRFDRFYSAHPSCSPTRGSFLTGRHPNRFGTFSPGYSIRPEEVTIAHLVEKAGYETAHFGKWHLGPVKKESPTNPSKMGFDEYLSHDNFFEIDPVFSRNGEDPQKFEGESSEIIVDETIKFIQNSKENKKPFLAVVWFGSPHEPYSGLPGDLALYDNLPDSLNNEQVSLTSNETGNQVQRPLGEVLRERYAEITAMDRSIGVLRDYLKKSNLRHNTLVLYCGDNGPPRSAGRTGMTVRAEKGLLYEGGILVPGVLEWPAVIDKPFTTDAIAVTSDFFPTINELIGGTAPEYPIDGTSLVPIINKAQKEREEELCFWQINRKQVVGENADQYIEAHLQEGTTPLAKKLNDKYTRSFKNFVYNDISKDDYKGPRSIMFKNFKLVVDDGPENTDIMELYDIEKDRMETNNIIDSHSDTAANMKEKLFKWQESVLHSLTGADYEE